MMRLAIISPAYNNYSETFIQAHRKIPDFETFFYFGGDLPTELDGYGSVRKLSFCQRIYRRLAPGNYTDERLFWKSLKKQKIDVVLAEYGTTGARIFSLCQQAGIPLVVHFHGYDISVFELRNKYAEAYKKMFQAAKRIISVSNEMTTMLTDFGCPPDKIVWTPCGPTSAFSQINAQPSGGKYFLSVGRFVDKKAPYLVLLAFIRAREMGCKAKLVLAGDGPLLNVCKTLTRYYGIQDEVQFPGVVKSDEIQRLIMGAIAYVQHSIRAENGDMEGTPVSVMEASAAGLPVISTLHGGIPDVVKHEVSGLLSAEGDVETMAKHMFQLYQEPAKAEELGLQGKGLIAAEFSQSLHLEKLSQTLKNVVAKN